MFPIALETFGLFSCIVGYCRNSSYLILVWGGTPVAVDATPFASDPLADPELLLNDTNHSRERTPETLEAFVEAVTRQEMLDVRRIELVGLRTPPVVPRAPALLMRRVDAQPAGAAARTPPPRCMGRGRPARYRLPAPRS